MPALTPMHLILIVAILLIVVGPGKLPDVGAALGRAAHDFRAASEGRETEPAETSGNDGAQARLQK